MLKYLLILFLLVYLSACEQANTPPPLAPLQSKVLKVVSHHGPNTYYTNDENQAAGLEYDLVTLFAKELGPDFQVQWILVDNVSQIIPSLLKNQANMAAADLSVTELRKRLVTFSKPYQDAQQVLVYNKEFTDKPNSINDLIGKRITVPRGTSYAERMQDLQQKYPQLRWRELAASADQLLEQVADGSLDYTLVDHHLIAMLQNFYPNLGIGMSVGKAEKIAWAFQKNTDPALIKKANDFMDKVAKDGTLRNLIDRYYGHVERLNPVDVTTFLQRTRTILPKYIHMFQQAQENTGIDWRLLAAISYQESHWDRYNTSPTNVRGMMMLTESTADRLGVTDRLDAKQSINAGARYTVILKEAMPSRIADPDRTWIALASYNIGYGHVEDARVLAQRLKLNPDSWADLKKTLPMLNKPEYYNTVKLGYASGGAPVIFVESIRTYYNILQKYQPPHVPIMPDIGWAEASNGNQMIP
jgi:membrane-bound lytic murein transglycosylase F